MGPVIAFLVGGIAASSKLYGLISVRPLQSPVTLLLPLAGIVVLAISLFYQSQVYKEAIGKVHLVTSIRSDNIGTVKFESVRLRVKSDSPISVGDYVKGGVQSGS